MAEFPAAGDRLATVIGGSGFLGRYIVRRFAQAGWRVRVAVRRPVSRALAWMRRWVDDVTTVEEDQIAAAVYELYHLTGLVVEPAAALPLAAARRSPLGRAGRICLILTGSNLDPRMRQALITAAAGPQDPGRDLPEASASVMT